MILFLKFVISYFVVTWAINYKPKEETPPKTQTYEECGEDEIERARR
jgi:NADH:ubiquinone oxidoreductase subunit 3 (subunit A)